uniref:MmgE/PrpD family protein n=1 Tax=candidate division WOR-3 bacterium TaxID=2052148 RepID=A0A7C2K0Q9_UNCW3
MHSISISEAIAEYVCSITFEKLPLEAVEAAKKSFLDTLGVILAASSLGEGCRYFVELVLEGNGREESTVLGFNKRVPCVMAAFANGSMSHALDYDDVYDEARVHPSAAVVPAALAISEVLGKVSGKRLLTAIAVGNDLVCRLGLSLKVDASEYGWFTPPIFGAFGATVAASYLLGLNKKQILNALSLTLCQVACTTEVINSPISDIRAIRDAFSAKAGVISALLAYKGIRGSVQPMEGEGGLFASFFRGQYDPSIILKGLGEIFYGPKVSYKLWPACRGTHSYIQAALELRKECEFSLEDVEEIRLIINSLNLMLCEPLEAKRRPENAINAKFSLPFVVATALVHGNVKLEHFRSTSLKDERVLALADKVVYEANDSKDLTEGTVEIKIKKKRLIKTINFPLGHPNNPTRLEDLITKFKECAQYAVNPISFENLKKIVELILELEQLDDIKTLTDLFNQNG